MIDEKYIAAIDLGTAKLVLSVAKVTGDDVQVIYYREHASEGITRSNVMNLMKASGPLRSAIGEAESELGIRIRQVVVGLPRYRVTQETANGRVERSTPDDYITREEVETLKSIAVESYPLDDMKNQIIYGAIAQSFSNDDQIQLLDEDVIGTVSESLEGNFKVFIGERRATTAIDKIFNDLGIAIAKKYFLPDVVARAVLSEEEKQNGVALIDFGAGVTSVTLYHGGIMRHYESIPFGAETITNDIRLECSITPRLAENIKKAYGACMPEKLASLSEKRIQIRYEDQPYKEVAVKFISRIIDARVREIFDAILYSIQESGLAGILRSGIVLTGGGANLANVKLLLKDMSGYNVRIGYPKHLFSAAGCTGVYDPSATAAIGMLLAAKNDRLPECLEAPAPQYDEPKEEEPLYQEVLEEEPAEAPAAEEPAQMSEEEFRHGSTGQLLGDDAWETVEPPKRKKKVRTEKNGFKMLWNKVVKAADGLYGQITDDNI